MQDSKLGKPSSSRGQQSDNALKSSTHLDQNVMSSLISEAQRCMSLYFALCTKVLIGLHSLPSCAFSYFNSCSELICQILMLLCRSILFSGKFSQYIKTYQRLQKRCSPYLNHKLYLCDRCCSAISSTAFFKTIGAVQAVHRQIPILVRTVGSSPELLAIISDPPTGSEDLLMKVFRIRQCTLWSILNFLLLWVRNRPKISCLLLPRIAQGPLILLPE